MRLAMIGRGRMGGNMSERLRKGGHEVVVYDRSAEAIQKYVSPGAGHYVKMVHNGIEYGMLQAYAEGYEILHASKDFRLDLHKIAAVWNHGSVVRSWLNELAETAFQNDADLTALKGYVEDSGEG